MNVIMREEGIGELGGKRGMEGGEGVIEKCGDGD